MVNKNNLDINLVITDEKSPEVSIEIFQLYYEGFVVEALKNMQKFSVGVEIIVQVGQQTMI